MLTRGETINLRASQKQKALIDRAAETLGRSRSDFMLETACREAESALLDRRYFVLSEDARGSWDTTPWPSEQSSRRKRRDA